MLLRQMYRRKRKIKDKANLGMNDKRDNQEIFFIYLKKYAMNNQD